MPLREDLLTPIAGDRPGGINLRYDPLYDKLKEARRQDDDLAQGAWQRERKLADYVQVIKLTQDALATQSKDLQLAAWLTEAMVKKEGLAGLRQSLDLCRALVQNFWDTLYPEVEEGDLELRTAPLDWIGATIGDAVKTLPLVRAGGHDWLKYQESRKVGYENQVQGDQAKKERAKKIKEGKLAPEEFDKAFAETPKAFYLNLEKNLDGCLESLKALDKSCHEKFGEDAAPTFGKLMDALGEVRHIAHGLLQEKRKTEPDPVEEAPADAPDGTPATGLAAPRGPAGLLIPFAATEPEDRRQTIANVAAAAAFLRKREPHSPAPYLMMRGLRWGELRAAVETQDPSVLEAPSTEIRRHIKTLALENKWAQLLEDAENVMSLPCSRAWLDLQRFVVEACAALGSEYDGIAKAIRSELRALLRDVPQLLQTMLLDDTPVANSQTQAWLLGLLQEPSPTPGTAPADGETKPAAPAAVADGNPEAGWKRSFVDTYQLAMEALRGGSHSKALELLQKEVEQQRSGRGRFLRKMQLVQVCIAAGKEDMAQPLLEDLAAAVETHKLDDWEDRDMVAQALLTIMKLSKRVQADAKEKQKLFERICRLNPARALEC